LFHEMLTGEAPFKAESATLSLARVLHHKVPPLHESHPEIPVEICELVDWLLQKEPPRRPQSAAEVLAALGFAASASSPEPAPARRPAPRADLEDPTAVAFIEPAP